MKVFNGKTAADDYMSSHTLTFSTPELTLTRFAFWLGDMVPDPKNPGQQMPRIMNFVEEKDFAPTPLVDDDKFVPTGAMKSIGGGLYGAVNTQTDSSSKFCPECGSKLSSIAKFCTECGANQD
ncbi:MAG: zinc ribbon domain-containing protein [Nitrosotalea sp.]